MILYQSGVMMASDKKPSDRQPQRPIERKSGRDGYAQDQRPERGAYREHGVTRKDHGSTDWDRPPPPPPKKREK